MTEIPDRATQIKKTAESSNKRDQVAIPQDVIDAKKLTESPVENLTRVQPVDVVMSDQNSSTHKKKSQLEESKAAKATLSSKNTGVMPSLRRQATQNSKIAETPSNNSILFFISILGLTEVAAKEIKSGAGSKRQVKSKFTHKKSTVS